MREAWDFFATPKNLERITPDDFHIEITSRPMPDRIHKGQIITYEMKPMLGIKTNWMTEITHVEENSFFIDEQRSGPYKIWHHEHWFEQRKDGVLMTDKVVYVMPFGIIGRLAHGLFVGRQIKHIFAHRKKAIAGRFGAKA